MWFADQFVKWYLIDGWVCLIGQLPCSQYCYRSSCYCLDVARFSLMKLSIIVLPLNPLFINYSFMSMSNYLPQGHDTSEKLRFYWSWASHWPALLSPYFNFRDLFSLVFGLICISVKLCYRYHLSKCLCINKYINILFYYWRIYLHTVNNLPLALRGNKRL